MAESEPNSKIIFEVTLDTDEVEFEIINEDNPTWTHTTKWLCDIVPPSLDLQIHKELYRIRKLHKSFYDCLDVTLTSTLNRNQRLIFAFGHDTLDHAIQMAAKFTEVQATLLQFTQDIDAKVEDIKLRVTGGDHTGSTEQDNTRTAPDTDTGREPGRRDIPQGSDQHGGACSHPSEMEALSPGATQESELPATSREEETRKSGTPQGRSSDTPATPTPARRDPRADRTLHEASRLGDMAAVKRILAAGRADVNCRGGGSTTPVMWAAYGGHRKMVKLLLSEGADVSLVDKDGDNTLHYACKGGDVATVKCVLSMHVADINSRGVWSRTPVMAAAYGGHRDVVELLVSEVADVSLVDEDGNNILHHACGGGDLETVKYVLSLHVADINSRGRGSRTPVMEAAWSGHRDVVKLLVSEGADVSLVNKVGNNILHHACSGGDVETVKYVLSLHVVDINSRGGDSWTPVMAAAYGGHRDVVELLVSEGADVSLVDKDGDNILHYACLGGDVETVKYVLSLHVVDIDARNNIGQTAADVARHEGHQEVVKLL